MGSVWRGIRLLLPRTHRRFLVYFVSKLRVDGALQSPQIPKTTSPLAVHFDFRFPQVPKNTKGPKGARNSKLGVVLGGFGATGKLIAKVHHHDGSKDPLTGRQGA